MPQAPGDRRRQPAAASRPELDESSFSPLCRPSPGLDGLVVSALLTALPTVLVVAEQSVGTP